MIPREDSMILAYARRLLKKLSTYTMRVFSGVTYTRI